MLVGVGGLLAACPSECEVACGKLEFCALLPGVSRRACIDTCETAPEDDANLCADCLDQSSCDHIAGGTCAKGCDPVLGVEGPQETPDEEAEDEAADAA